MGINQELSFSFRTIKLPVISRGKGAEEQAKHTLERVNKAVHTDHSEIQRKLSKVQG